MIYILVGAASCFSAFIARYIYVNKIFTTFFFILSIIIPAGVAGTRYNNGADYFLYMNIFETISSGQEFFSVKELEPGFVSIVKFCTIISESPVFMYFLIAFIIIFLYYKGVWENSPGYCFSILLFFLTGTYFDTFDGLRQYVAAAILFWGIRYILTENLKKYFVVVLIASTMHISSLFMLPVYAIAKFKFNLKQAIIIGVIIIFVSQYIFQAVTYLLQFTSYSYFLNSSEYFIKPTIGSILYTSINTLIICIIFIIHRHRFSKHDWIYFNAQILTWYCTLLSFSIPLAARLQYYFLPLELLILPNLIEKINSRYKFFVYFVVMVMYASITITGIVENNWYDCLPYNFYFDFHN